MSDTNGVVLGASTIALPIATGYFGNIAIWVMLGIFALTNSSLQHYNKDDCKKDLKGHAIS